MLFKENDPRLAAICRDVEAATAKDPRCKDLQIAVLLLDLGALPESSTTDVFVDGGAAYRRSTKEILIDPSFLKRDLKVQVAVMAHELGHAVAHLNDLRWEKSQALDQMGEEFVADQLACEWGFQSGLVAERNESYGPQYVTALASWEDPADYRRKMNIWRTKRAAGLIPKVTGK